MPLKRTITSRLLRGLEPLLASRGHADLIDEAGLDDAAAFDVDGVIPFEPLLRLFELMAERTGQDSFGIRLGAEQAHSSAGLFHYIVTSAPNLGEALKRSTIFFGLVSNSYSLSYARDATGANYEWHFDDSPAERIQFTDFSIALALARARHQLGANWNPVRVEFDHPRPANIKDFENILKCEMIFDRPKPLIRFDRASLDSPMRDSDPVLSETLENLGRRQLGLPKFAEPTVEKLVDVVRRMLPEGVVTDELAAERLGMTKKSLDRQLEQAGTSFRAVVDDVRSSMARHLLEETEIPLTEVAFLLGYSELSAFSRAAKNWFEESPSSYRRRMRA